MNVYLIFTPYVLTVQLCLNIVELQYIIVDLNAIFEFEFEFMHICTT